LWGAVRTRHSLIIVSELSQARTESPGEWAAGKPCKLKGGAVGLMWIQKTTVFGTDKKKGPVALLLPSLLVGEVSLITISRH
jgi:hypothetical protein